jgi:hypothetical protein
LSAGQPRASSARTSARAAQPAAAACGDGRPQLGQAGVAGQDGALEQVAQRHHLGRAQAVGQRLLDRLGGRQHVQDRVAAGRGERIACVRGEAALEQAAVDQRTQGHAADVDAGVGDMLGDLGRAQAVAHRQQRQHEEVRIAQLALAQRAPEAGHELEVGAAEQVAQQVLGVRRFRGRGLGLGRYRARLARGERVAAGHVEQRRPFAAVIGQHLADEDDVVAAVVAERGAALEAGAAAGDQRHVALARVKRDTGELVLAGAGEAVRQRLLVIGQDVHVPELGRLEHGQAARVAGQAPQHHRGLQRHRIEAVGRDADRRAVGGTRGHDGHAGGKHAQRLPEVPGVEHGMPPFVWSIVERQHGPAVRALNPPHGRWRRRIAATRQPLVRSDDCAPSPRCNHASTAAEDDRHERADT